MRKEGRRRWWWWRRWWKMVDGHLGNEILLAISWKYQPVRMPDCRHWHRQVAPDNQIIGQRFARINRICAKALVGLHVIAGNTVIAVEIVQHFGRQRVTIYSPDVFQATEIGKRNIAPAGFPLARAARHPACTGRPGRKISRAVWIWLFGTLLAFRPGWAGTRAGTAISAACTGKICTAECAAGVAAFGLGHWRRFPCACLGRWRRWRWRWSRLERRWNRGVLLRRERWGRRLWPHRFRIRGGWHSRGFLLCWRCPGRRYR